MLIGEKSNFAVEWDIVSTFEGFVYAHFRFWIAGEPIGDWNEEVVLGVLIHSAKAFLMFKGERHLPETDGMNSEELWSHIEHYCNSDDPFEMNTAIAGNYRLRFLVHEIADDSVAPLCSIIVVDQINGTQRLVWKRAGSTRIHEAKFSKLLVDEVIADFVRSAYPEMTVRSSC